MSTFGILALTFGIAAVCICVIIFSGTVLINYYFQERDKSWRKAFGDFGKALQEMAKAVEDSKMEPKN